VTGSRSNFSRTRVRKVPDFGRIAEGISRPGIDPRVWLALARVDDDPDAVVWDEALGWIVDVTFVGGPLDGDGPCPCRVASGGEGAGVGYARPPRAGGLVVVQIINGDANDDAVILGQLWEQRTAAPSSVNGDSIVERDPQSGEVAAAETHIAVFPEEDVDEEWRNVRVTGERMVLGAPDADQPFIRGDDYADAEADFVDAVETYSGQIEGAFQALVPPGPPVTPVTGAQASAALLAIQAAGIPLQLAIQQFKSARDTYLSTRIVGD
jgi:hypothetical protein